MALPPEQPPQITPAWGIPASGVTEFRRQTPRRGIRRELLLRQTLCPLALGLTWVICEPRECACGAAAPRTELAPAILSADARDPAEGQSCAPATALEGTGLASLRRIRARVFPCDTRRSRQADRGMAAGMAAAHAELRSTYPAQCGHRALRRSGAPRFGPTEVFTAAGSFGAFRVYTVAATRNPITSQNAVRAIPDFSVDAAPTPDILVLPGGNSTMFSRSSKAMAWVDRVARKNELSMSVCRGAFILARLGLLDGLSATTYPTVMPELEAMGVRTEDRPLVVHGNIATGGGCLALPDLCTRMGARLLTAEAAEKVRASFQPNGGFAVFGNGRSDLV